jgi:ubiquitin-protein ligase
MMKRVNNEYKLLHNTYDEVTYDDNNTSPSFNQNRIKITVKLDKNILAFTFNNDYPFKPPKMTINNIDSGKCYKISNFIMLNELKRIYNNKCLCCETIMCPHNWSPAHRLTKIINEYNKNKIIIKYLRNYYWLLKINKLHDYMLPDLAIICIRDTLFRLEHQQLKHP